MEKADMIQGAQQGVRIKGKAFELVSRIVLISCAVFSIVAILSIAVYLLAAGVPGIAEVGLFKFLFGTVWRPTDTTLPVGDRFGILPFILGTIYITAGAVLLGGTAGIFAACFLSRFCPKKLKTVLRQAVNLLAGLPSVIYGFIGLTVLVPFLREAGKALGAPSTITGSGILAGSIVLGIMILPTIISLSVNALDAVPESCFEGALALGASKSQAMFRVVLPAAKQGVLTGILLGAGRALGETMAIVLVCGGAAVMPNGILTPMRTLTANVVMEMGYADGLHRSMLLSTGLVLFVLVLLLTLSINLLSNRERGGKRPSRPKKGAMLAAGAVGGETAETLQPRNVDALFSVNAGSAAETAAALPPRLTSQTAKGTKRPTAEFARDIEVCTVELSGGARSESEAERQARSVQMETKSKFTFCKFLTIVSLVSMALSCLTLIALVVFVFVKGLPGINLHFLFGRHTERNFSISGIFITTLKLVFLSILMAAPVGVATAIFLTEFSGKNTWFIRIIRGTLQTLSGVPSIVFGLFGMLLFVNTLKVGVGVWAGSITLALMILPTIVTTVEDSLLAVPLSYREASLGLGAGRARTSFKVVLPAALPGVLTGIILGMGRVVSESACVLFTAGSSFKMAKTFGGEGASLAVAMYLLASEGHFDKAYSVGVVLILLVVGLNLAASLIAAKFKKG